MDESMVEKLAGRRPKRIKKHVSRPCHDEKTAEIALKTLDKTKEYRDYDKVLNVTLIKIAFYTGLRNSET